MSKPRIDSINLPRRLREGLAEADELLEKGKADQALQILQELDKRYPNQVYVLEMLSDACIDLEDNRGYLRAIRRLHRLTPNRSQVKLTLANAYLVNTFPALALITFREFLRRWPQHEHADEARKTVEKLEEALPNLLKDAGLSFETDLDFACQHEEAQVCLHTGEFGRAKSLIEEMQRQKPNFTASLNNLGQIYWLEGDLPRAIEVSRRTLAIEADNIHALANLIRYLYLAGQKEEAAPLVERLKASTAEAAERWTKIAEALAFIGDDQGVLELAAQAEKEANPLELDERFHHLVAASECLLGKEKQARARWQRALKINPHFEPAQENLDDLKKPAHERNGPWAFSIQQMLPQNIIHETMRIIERAVKSKDKKSLQTAVCRFVDNHPELLQMVPLLLERGDATAKDYVINLADTSAHPELLALLKEYAFGQQGSDRLRMKAAQTLSQHQATPTGTVKMWLKGEWREILLLGFEITSEPLLDENPLNRKAIDLMEKAIHALRHEDGAAAEQHLRKALALHPEHPSLLNNLALALFMQDKDEEAKAILQHVMNDFPDYFFGQMALARKSIQAGEVDQAHSILNHWMEAKKKYHITEFSMLCKTQIDLFLAEENIAGARSWMEMWESIEPEDDPDYEQYRTRLELSDLLSKFKEKNKKPKTKKGVTHV